MIIRFPTGLYKSVLPAGKESGNITYTISTQDPPKTNVRITQIPPGEEFQPAPDKIFDDATRREQFGDLIYTIANNSRSLPGSNIKQFELGEILAFEENPPQQEVQSLRSPDSIEIRHDTNVLDLSSLGLTDEEIVVLVAGSEEKQAELEQEFNDKNIEAKNLDTAITENQKKINETNKAIKATREVFDIPEGDLTFDQPIYQKLLETLAKLEVLRVELIIRRNDIVPELREITQAIFRVSELVR